MFSLRTLILSLAITAFGTLSLSQVEAKEVKVTNQAIANMTWEIFGGGCIENGINLENWANKQIYLTEAEEKKLNLEGLWQKLGYPVEHEVKDIWGAVGQKVFLYQHSQQGCTVTSEAAVSQKMLKQAFENTGKSFKARSGRSYTINSSTSNGVTKILAVLGPENKEKTYLLGRILPENESGLRTILYYFKSEHDVKI